MKRKNTIKKFNTAATITIFLSLLFLPNLTFPFVKDLLPADTSENRELADRPTLSLDTLETFPSDYDNYYNDHLPYRAQIRQAWANFNFFILDDLITDRVLIGKTDGGRQDAWLFYTSPKDGNPVKEAQGITTFSKSDQTKIKNTLEENTKNLAENNIKLYYLIAPDKENVYREELPENITIYHDDSRTDLLYQKLSEQGITNLIYPRNELLNAKSTAQTYYKQDTHWNAFGGFIGFQSIMSKIEPGYTDFSYQLEANPAPASDLIPMTSINGYFAKDTSSPSVSYLPNSKFSQETFEAAPGANGKVDITENPSAPIDKTILFVGDSFRNATKEYFFKTFSKCIFMHRAVYEKSHLSTYQPDIVIAEFVERYTGQIKSFHLSD